MIGAANASYYLEDQLLVIWHCSRALCGYIIEQGHLPDDEELHALWSGFEGVLAEVLPEPQRVAAPTHVWIDDPEDWRAFLLLRGYRRFNDEVMIKHW